VTHTEPATTNRVKDAILGAIALVAISGMGFLGKQFWVEWMQQPDQAISVIAAVAGVLVGMRSYQFPGLWTIRRFVASLLLAGLSVATAASCWYLNLPELSAVAIGFLVAAWFGFVVRGESVMMGLMVGALLMFPAMVHAPLITSLFQWIEVVAKSVTQNLCDAASIPLAVTDSGLWLAQGVASRFAASGTWDSWLALLGVALFLLLAGKRNAATVVLVLPLTLLIWLGLRGGGWFGLIAVSNARGVWFDWTIWVQIVVFLIATLTVAGISRFLSLVFTEIPVEHFTQTAPLVPYLWNWMCGLPKLVYRVPEDSHIYKDWSTHLLMHQEHPTPQTDFRWLRMKSFDSLLHPLSFLGGIIDGIRGWRYSRNWNSIWGSIAAWSVPILAVVLMSVGAINRDEHTVRQLSDACERRISNDKFELLSDQLQEPEFGKLAGSRTDPTTKTIEISPDDKECVTVLSERIVQLQPSNAWANFRLAILGMIEEPSEDARQSIAKLASREFGNFAPAHEWMAKELILRRVADKNISTNDIVGHIEGSLLSRNLDGRLLRDYSRYLEGKGSIDRAVELAKRAATAEPDLLLDLVQLYARIKHADFEATADQAEQHFRKKLNLPTERESDRIAISRIGVLTERMEVAANVLTEALQSGTASPSLRRELSELYRNQYRKTRKKNDQGIFEANLELLEKAIEADPLNPTLSAEVAELLPLNIAPTPKLLATLQEHIKLDITISSTHVLIGESYFDNQKIDEAMKHWNIALAKDPRNAIAMNNLAYCLAQKDPPECDKALELLDRALALLPDNAHILDTQGGVLLKANRPKEAINKLERAIRGNRNLNAARKKLIEAYRSAGMTVEADLQERILKDVENQGTMPSKSIAVDLPES
jgi:tetratricopeptide (TPR) repeat protein